ncbi:DUF6542 domain-containing protein [Aeromicrobium sp. UC242_57]|uniref:DUF6542 domain-containing protein n=1 Tax=Aeromicrobium sp. UC242_57 TaxID=3374624 RepID=UPI0037B191BB
MTQAVSPTPGGMARRDLSVRQAIVAACVAMAVVTGIDLADGRLDLLFSVGFVLIVITVPMSVDVRSLFPTGVFPPVLLIVTLLAVCIIAPSAIQVDGMAKDAGTIARLIAATIDHGLTLLVGHGIALILIAWRILTDAER